MLRTSSLYPLSREFKRRLRRGLALWVKGTVLAHNGCQDSTAAALDMHGRFETLRRELREWTCDDADRIRSWGPGTEVDAAACFPELLRWVLDLWTPGEGHSATGPPLVLVCDPTHQRDEWVALAVSVVYRAQAIPVAWHVVKADAPESWVAHYRRLPGRLAPAVPSGMPVHVLCDRGLGSRKLWTRIVEPGWHPVLRYAPAITFRPTGGDRVPVRALGGGPGTLWLGAGEAFADKPLPCTPVVLHAQDCEAPWALLTDIPPDRTKASLYACRHWIEQGFRGLKRGGWQWGRTDPLRVGLRGRVCRVWAPRGVAVSQEVRTGWKYTYVAVAIDPLTGRLWWAWQASMKGTEMARIWGAWAEDPAIDGWVRDGAGGHKGEDMQAVDAPQVVQPPHAPELNPVERFFRELRRAIEGKVYPDLQARQADPERVKRLCGWDWIRKALKDLPAADATP